MKALPRILFASFIASISTSARADVKMPAIFSDHMVVQRDVSVPVWGLADPNEEVTVTIAGQTKSAKADGNGKWMVKLPELKIGEPTTLTVKGKNEIVINDVLIGEVWLGSGQSNMAMSVKSAKDFVQEQKMANLHQVRMFKEESGEAGEPQLIGAGKWVICGADSVGGFSATLYFFGREIHKTLGVPVGLINSSVGGTPIESWIAPESQKANQELKPFFEAVVKGDQNVVTEAAVKKFEAANVMWQSAVKKAKAENKPLPRKPRDPREIISRKANVGGLFNGKISPLIPYAIRGALWYQGEANSVPTKAPFYKHQLPLLITDWRARWGYDFHFAWVQLPNFGGVGRDWPTVREAMLKTLTLPKTGMSINIDIGEEKNIHPLNKQEVGRRLSLWALGSVYGQKVTSTSGPLPAGHEIRDHEIVLRFAHADGGLTAKNGDLQGFVIAGTDKQWKPAKARIEGATVIASSSDVPKPVAVRYAWENFPTCNLYNNAGLPASPFRTDDWETVIIQNNSPEDIKNRTKNSATTTPEKKDN